MSRLRQKLFESYAAHYARGNADINPMSVSPKALASMEQTYGPALGKVPQGGRVLDAGCGTGFLLHWLLERGGVVPVGVDASPSQMEVLRRHLPGVEVHCGDALTFMRERQSQFDAIFCTDVLEHVADDELLDWVETARAALKPGGVFVCRVPNAANLAASQLRYIDLTHKRSFTTTSLAQLFEAAGMPEWRVLPVRAAHLTGNVRLVAERLLHRAVYLVCGNARERVFTRTLSACAVRS